MDLIVGAVTSTVRLPYDLAMRLHLTLSDRAVAKLRKLAKAANCSGDNDRELMQAYLHHLTGETEPAWGGARENSGPKPSKKKKK